MNTENWERFYLINYFDMYAGTYYPSDSYEKGTTPLVSASNTTNGIMAWTNLEPKYPAFSITIGKVEMTSFVQPYPFCASPDVTILVSKNELNIYQLMFVKTILDKECFRWNYGNQIRLNDSKRVRIKLPAIINEIGEIVPDWHWMEDYAINVLLPQLPEKARQVWEKKYNNKPISSQKLELKVEDWKWFDYFGKNGLFEITGSKTTPKDILEESSKGSYPYVTTQAVNNGIEGYFNIATENGGVFTVDSAVLGFCAYQEKDFSASDHVEKLIPKFSCNKYIAMFLTTLINREQYRYNYGRKASQTKLKSSKIKLPATTNEQGETVPDWQWMEDYIKGLPYSGAI